MDKVAFGALCVLTFLTPWDNTIQLAGAVSLARIVGIGAFGLGILAVLVSGNLRRPHVVHVLASLFLFWSILTLLWTVSLEATLVRTFTYLQVVTLLILIWQYARAESQQNVLFGCYVLGAYVPAFDTIIHYLAGQSINASEVRYAATGFNANEVAIILVLGIPMAWYLALVAKRRIYAIVNVCYVPVALVAVLLTASRGAFLAVAFALLLIPWSMPRLSTRAKVGLVALFVLSTGIVGAMVPGAVWTRLAETPQQISDGDLSERGLIWRFALRDSLDYPVAGMGAGAYEQVSQRIDGKRVGTHQTFLAVLVGQGIIGLTLFLSMFVAAFSAIRKMKDLQRKFWIILAMTLVIGLVPRDWDYRKPTWFLVGVLTAQAALVRRRDSELVATEQVVLRRLQLLPETRR